MKVIFVFLLVISCAVCVYGQGMDTFEVYFDKNVTQLDKLATETLDKLIEKKMLVRGQKLMMLGYTDYTGNVAHNNTLSEARAKNVRNYLITKGFDENDLRLCLGKGEIIRAGKSGAEGIPHDRKVQVIREERTVRGEKIDKTPLKNGQLVNTGSTKSASAPTLSVQDMANLKVNEAIALKNIIFQAGTSLFLPSSLPELENLYIYLNKNKSVKIKIEGHVCCMGTVQRIDSANFSGARAKAVFDYLAKKGIAINRMQYVGLGNINPVVAEEKTEDDMMRNRRVEIRILSK